MDCYAFARTMVLPSHWMWIMLETSLHWFLYLMGSMILSRTLWQILRRLTSSLAITIHLPEMLPLRLCWWQLYLKRYIGWRTLYQILTALLIPHMGPFGIWSVRLLQLCASSVTWVHCLIHQRYIPRSFNQQFRSSKQNIIENVNQAFPGCHATGCYVRIPGKPFRIVLGRPQRWQLQSLKLHIAVYLVNASSHYFERLEMCIRLDVFASACLKFFVMGKGMGKGMGMFKVVIYQNAAIDHRSTKIDILITKIFLKHKSLLIILQLFVKNNTFVWVTQVVLVILRNKIEICVHSYPRSTLTMIFISRIISNIYLFWNETVRFLSIKTVCKRISSVLLNQLYSFGW